jgi:hypothetical protein
MTAFSLDIDPIRPRGTSSSDGDHRRAINFAMRLQHKIGGCVDDSGNGAYLWFPFIDPIAITSDIREGLKMACQDWQREIIARYRPEQHRLRIDGCFDFSRMKKVIGTASVKGKKHRLSRFVQKSPPSNRVRDEILRIQASAKSPATRPRLGRLGANRSIPKRFLDLLGEDDGIRDLWCRPDSGGDTSVHDWKLGCVCIESGITEPSAIAAILRLNPFGKYQRDRRESYIRTTVTNLLSGEHAAIKDSYQGIHTGGAPTRNMDHQK